MDERQRVVTAAYGWIGTPYHSLGRVKGVGVDCLTLLAEVYTEAGLIPRIEIEHYPSDWHLHRSEERYLAGLLRYTHEIETPLQGDIALWKFGRCFSHGAIVIAWPMIIHSYIGTGCRIENAEQASFLTHVGENGPDRGKVRPKRFFSYWG